MATGAGGWQLPGALVTGAKLEFEVNAGKEARVKMVKRMRDKDKAKTREPLLVARWLRGSRRADS